VRAPVGFEVENPSNAPGGNRSLSGWIVRQLTTQILLSVRRPTD
jgi:hypothetical protein